MFDCIRLFNICQIWQYLNVCVYSIIATIYLSVYVMPNLWSNNENIETWSSQQNAAPQERSILNYVEAYLWADISQWYESADETGRKIILTDLLAKAIEHKFSLNLQEWKIPVGLSIHELVINQDTSLEEAEALISKAVWNVEESKTTVEFVKSSLISQPNKTAVDDLTAKLNDTWWVEAKEWMSRKELAYAVIDRLAEEYTMLQPQIDKLKEIVIEYSSKDYYKVITDYLTKKKLATVGSIKKMPQQLKDKISSFGESIDFLRKKKTADKVTNQLIELKKNKDREWGLKYLHLKSWITKTKIWFMFAKLQTKKISDVSNKKKRDLSIKLVKDITDRFKLFPWIYTLAMDIANGYLNTSTIQLLTREDIYWKTEPVKNISERKESFTWLKKAS